MSDKLNINDAAVTPAFYNIDGNEAAIGLFSLQPKPEHAHVVTPVYFVKKDGVFEEFGRYSQIGREIYEEFKHSQIVSFFLRDFNKKWAKLDLEDNTGGIDMSDANLLSEILRFRVKVTAEGLVVDG